MGWWILWLMKNKLFIDSGAYSAATQGAKIPLERYIAFLKQNSNVISVAASLDVIGDAKATWEAWQIMRQQGADCIPTFHHGEDPAYLWAMLHKEKVPFLALGGQVGLHPSAQMVWLDDMWSNYLTDGDGLPLTRVHGFGITAPSVIRRYPWWSVDSTSWCLASAMGRVFFCVQKGEEPQLVTLAVSEKSPAADAADQHWSTITPAARTAFERIANDAGFAIEDLANDHKARWMCNALAYNTFTESCKLEPLGVQQESLFESLAKAPTRPGKLDWTKRTLFLAGNLPKGITTMLMQKGYSRLLSYHYIDKGSDFTEAKTFMEKQNDNHQA